MPKERMSDYTLDWRLTTLTLGFFVAIFAGCSTAERQAQLPPVLRAERQLARAERIRSDPSQKAAEILSAARTALGEISKSSGDPNESLVNVYNHAAADLGDELPELAKYRGSLESLSIQDRHTGEIYRLQLGPA